MFHAGLLLLSSRVAFSSDGAPTARAQRAPAPTDAIQVVSVAPPSRPAVEPDASPPSENARPIPSLSPPRRAARVASIAVLDRQAVEGRPLSVPSGLGRGVVAVGGSGTGAGAGSDGAPDTYVPPRARTILETWRPPASIYGQEVMARVYTDAAGRSLGQVILVNPTRDARTNRWIMSRVRDMEYWPGLLNGEPTAAWAEITFEFCRHGTTAASPPSPGFGVGVPCMGDAPAPSASGGPPDG